MIEPRIGGVLLEGDRLIGGGQSLVKSPQKPQYGGAIAPEICMIWLETDSAVGGGEGFFRTV